MLNINYKAISNSTLFKYGLPFFIVVVGGSFALKGFTSLRYEYSQIQKIDPAELEKVGIKMKKREEVTLEKEYEKLQKLNIDNWEQVRGPRPWEEETLKQNKTKT